MSDVFWAEKGAHPTTRPGCAVDDTDTGLPKASTLVESEQSLYGVLRVIRRRHDYIRDL